MTDHITRNHSYKPFKYLKLVWKGSRIEIKGGRSACNTVLPEDIFYLASKTECEGVSYRK